MTPRLPASPSPAPRRFAPGAVTVSGRLVADRDGIMTIEPRLRHDQRETSGSGPIEPRASLHLQLTDLDLAQVPGVRHDASHAQAWVELTAVITSDGVARVEACNPASTLHDFWDPEPSTRLAGDTTSTPNRPPRIFPAPGTVRSEKEMIDAGVIVSRKVLRVPDGGKRYVVSTTAPEVVERELRAEYGSDLIVRRSHWSTTQYREATDTLNQHFDRWGLLVIGDHNGPHGEVKIVVFSIDRHHEMSTWINTQPQGLIDHRPWLRRR